MLVAFISGIIMLLALAWMFELIGSKRSAGPP